MGPGKFREGVWDWSQNLASVLVLEKRIHGKNYRGYWLISEVDGVPGESWIGFARQQG